jgi:cardiolipin synthase C
MQSLIYILILIFSFSVIADDVSIYTSRLEAQRKRDEMILRERKQLRISTFIFELDEQGKKTLGLMLDRARHGVEVYLAVDGLLRGLPTEYAMMKALEESGIHIKIFNPMIRDVLSANDRNHMKSVITSEELLVGDRNITQDYYQRGVNHNYLGTEAAIRGKSVQKASEHFDSIFNSTDMQAPSGLVTRGAIDAAKKELEGYMTAAVEAASKLPPLSPKVSYPAESVRYVADPAGGLKMKKALGMHRDIFDLINRSKHTLEITNPFVLLTPELKKSLQDAIDRGVKITISSNAAHTTDSKLMGIAWEAKKDELLDMGIELHELKKGNFLHTKTMVRDGEEVFIGSYNKDPRAQNLNLENGVIIKDKKVAERISTHNRRINHTLMTKVTRTDTSKFTPAQKMGHCVKKSIRNLITDSLASFL